MKMINEKTFDRVHYLIGLVVLPAALLVAVTVLSRFGIMDLESDTSTASGLIADIAFSIFLIGGFLAISCYRFKNAGANLGLIYAVAIALIASRLFFYFGYVDGLAHAVTILGRLLVIPVVIIGLLRKPKLA